MAHEADEAFMAAAVALAREAAERDEVPVGALIVRGDRVIARAHNQVEQLRDPTAHAEMIALTQAAGTIGRKWLLGCTMYVTIEPCSMCAGALVLARVERVVYGAADPKAGACGSVLDVLGEPRLNHRVRVRGGVAGPLCGELMRAFFQAKRGDGATEGS